MKIKTTLNELFEKQYALYQLDSIPLPVTAVYKLSKAYKLIQKRLEKFDKKRIELVNKYGEIRDNEDIKEINKDSTNWNDFLEEIAKILDKPTEIEIEQIKVDDLGDIKVPMSWIEPLIGFFIEE